MDFLFLEFELIKFADYIREQIKNKNLLEIEKLDLECCFADDLRILIV
jgi:hypothetical protein